MTDLTAIPVRGEPLRYYVHSQSEPDATHVVDLSENGGNGECSCEDFSFRRGPNHHKAGKIIEFERDKKGKTNAESTRCKHLNAAALQFANEQLKEKVETVSRRAKVEKIRESADGLPF